MLSKNNLIFLTLICLLLSTLRGYALDPQKTFKEMSSENFEIIYDAKNYELAKKVLEEAERSHRILAPIFGEAPKKTAIVVDDSVDIANGAATGVPRPTVYVFTAMPTSLASIDHFSNWPRDVFLHEYAHILNMQPASGVFAVLRAIFGSVIRPNMLLPRWYLEGLAVEMESRYNLKGRLKSPDYDALIRAFLIDGKWGTENLSQINEVTTPYWPEGQRPYFFGALIWHEIMEKKEKDPQFLARINDRYGGRIPFFISAPIIDEVGNSYEGVLGSLYGKYSVTGRKQIEQVSKTEAKSYATMTFEDSVVDHSPAISPDGKKFAFISKNLDGDYYIAVRDIPTIEKEKNYKILLKFNKDKEPKDKLLDITDPQKISWSPDGKKIIYDSAEEFDRYSLVYEINEWDLTTDKIKKLTTGLRGREPSYSPDGKKIIFVKHELGQTLLGEMTSDGKNPQILYTPPKNLRVSRPTYMNSSEIIFAQKDESGEDQLHVFNLSTKSLTKKMSGLKNSKFPMKSKNGVVFTSTDSGIENLYWANWELKNIRPLTNSKTRIINGAYSEETNRVVASELTSDGPKIRILEPITQKSLPQIEHLIAKNYPTAIDDSTPKLNPRQESYWPIEYLFPQYWIPFVLFPADGVIAGFSTSASDPTGFHSYLLSAQYDSRPQDWNGYFQYNYVNSMGTTSLAGFDMDTYYDSIDENTNSQGAFFNHSFFIPGLSSKWLAHINYEYTQRNSLFFADGGYQNNEHYFTGPEIGFMYSNMRQGNMDISPRGISFGASYRYYLENSTGSEHDSTLAKFNYYHSKWLPDRHVWAFMLKGIYTDPNRNIFLATTTTEAEYALGPLLDGIVVRGYPSGQFIGYTIYSGSTEYRFPILNNYSGPSDPFPYFLKRIHANIFADAVTLKGIYFDSDLDAYRNAEVGRFFGTAGAELKFDSTLFYHVPATLKITGYYAFRDEADGGAGWYVSINTPEAF